MDLYHCFVMQSFNVVPDLRVYQPRYYQKSLIVLFLARSVISVITRAHSRTSLDVLSRAPSAIRSCSFPARTTAHMLPLILHVSLIDGHVTPYNLIHLRCKFLYQQPVLYWIRLYRTTLFSQHMFRPFFSLFIASVVTSNGWSREWVLGMLSKILIHFTYKLYVTSISCFSLLIYFSVWKFLNETKKHFCLTTWGIYIYLFF